MFEKEVQKKLVYVAGPYTSVDRNHVDRNIAVAYQTGVELATKGVVPVIPHTMYGMWEGKFSYDFILSLDFELIKRCDAIYKISDSPGTTIELRLARELGIPVFERMDVLKEWVSDEKLQDKLYEE